MPAIVFRNDPFPLAHETDLLFQASWGTSPQDLKAVLKQSLVHIGAYAGPQLVGFVNVAWDGGRHAFLLDTTVHPDHQRQGIGTALVKHATDAARLRGAMWLHVDFAPELATFHAACGFRPTNAGVIRLAD